MLEKTGEIIFPMVILKNKRTEDMINTSQDSGSKIVLKFYQVIGN